MTRNVKSLCQQIIRELNEQPDLLIEKSIGVEQPSGMLESDIRMLDQVNMLTQYRENICNFLQNPPIPVSLHWAQSLNNPLSIPASLQGNYAEQVDLWQKKFPNKTLLQAAFEIYQATPEYDEHFSHYIASCLDPTYTQVMGEISHNYLKMHKQDKEYKLEKYEQDMGNCWKKDGLTHIFMITARNMPNVGQWGMHSHAMQMVFNELESCTCWDEPLQKLCAIQEDMLPVCTILEQVLSLVRKPANPPNDLQMLLTNASTYVQACIPKYLLCPVLAGFNKPTWGYQTLGLAVKNSKLCITTSDFSMCIQPNANAKRNTNVNTLFLKLGEVVQSKEMHDLRASPNIAAKVESIRKQFEQITDFKFMQPVTIVSWKLELPKKAMTCMKIPSDHCFSEPHRVMRKPTNDKSIFQNLSGISVVQQSDMHFRSMVTNVLQKQFKNMQAIQYENNKEIHSALHETLACFTLHTPLLHNIIELHQSMPWTHEYEDSRYAETQVANNNCARYRDWCTLLQSPIKGMYKSRLEAHVLTSPTSLYKTYCPWLHASEHTWVQVFSSLPMQAKILHSPANEFNAKNLLQSVNNRFKHDLRQLPLRDPSFTILKEDIHTYTCEDSKSVVVAYSCREDPAKNIDFLMFRFVSI